jgi:membrane-bound lytic murein transglycosylase D
MIKKHIITCTIIIALLVMAKVFASSMPQAAKSLFVKDNKTVPNTTKITENRSAEKASPVKVKAKKKSGSLMSRLNFAKETLPLGDIRVERKMKRALTAFKYKTTQTHRLQRKAAEWFPVIEPILAAHGIPEDFKYMPLVESGLQGGTSPKGAAGFWQFMPGTARSYGLKINSKVDERKNLRKSTIAACRYLKDLYGVFDSWTLVAAAYNVGDNHMRKQINRQKQDNYFKMRLNRETGKYVYKLISMKQIVENPERYGYQAPKELLAYNE